MGVYGYKVVVTDDLTLGLHGLFCTTKTNSILACHFITIIYLLPARPINEAELGLLPSFPNGVQTGMVGYSGAGQGQDMGA